MILVHHAVLADNLKAEYRSDAEAILKTIFEDPDSAVEQTGKLKIEGWFVVGYWRTGKVYRLVKAGDEDPYVRLRSIPRSKHQLLEPRHFGLDPLTNTARVRSTAMRLTTGSEIVVLKESRSLSTSLNFKREMTVNEARTHARKESIRSSSLFAG